MLAAALTANSEVSTVPTTLRGSQPAVGQQGRRGHRAPAAAAGGVDEPGEHPERGEELQRGRFADSRSRNPMMNRARM